MAAYDVAVIGAGSFGSWTAWHLRRAGQRVLLVDAWGPGHSRSSSGGETRIIRMGYGADAAYTRMAIRSLALWKELQGRTGEGLFHPTGALWLARRNEPYSTATEETLAREQVMYQILAAGELAERYSQFHLPERGAYGIFEPDSGVLMARRAVAAVVRDGVNQGVKYTTASVDPRTAPQQIDAGQFVFACGPWLPKLFPELLARRIYPTRQEVFFFAPPAGHRGFAAGAFPAWIDFTDPRGPYGIPDIENRGVKIGFDLHGPAFDPDTGDRQVSHESVDAARQFVAERIPALASAPLTESRVCQYANTSSGDFLLDRHPDFPNVWLAGGGSGHGFKHGPAIGEYLCGRLLDEIPAEPRFSLATKFEDQHRTVY